MAKILLMKNTETGLEFHVKEGSEQHEILKKYQHFVVVGEAKQKEPKKPQPQPQKK